MMMNSISTKEGRAFDFCIFVLLSRIPLLHGQMVKFNEPPYYHFVMDSESKRGGRVNLPQKDLSIVELASVLNVLAKEYHTTLPSLLRKLDRVSGNLEHLDHVYGGDSKYEWTEE